VTYLADESARQCRVLHPVHCCLGDLVCPGYCSISDDVGLFGGLLRDCLKSNHHQKDVSDFISAELQLINKFNKSGFIYWSQLNQIKFSFIYKAPNHYKRHLRATQRLQYCTSYLVSSRGTETDFKLCVLCGFVCFKKNRSGELERLFCHCFWLYDRGYPHLNPII